MKNSLYTRGLEPSPLRVVPKFEPKLQVLKNDDEISNKLERLKFKPYKGLQIVCKVCGKTIHKNGRSYKGCSHPLDRQVYKAVIKDPFTLKVKTRDLKSKVYDEAIIELLDFKNELNIPVLYKEPEKAKPKLLIDCLAAYLDWLNNVDVYASKVRVRTPEHLEGVSIYLEKFCDFISEKNLNIQTLKVNDIPNSLLENDFYLYVCNYISPKTKALIADETKNCFIRKVKAFYKWMFDNEYISRNPMNGIKYFNTDGEIKEIITETEYLKLIELVKAAHKSDNLQLKGKINTHSTKWVSNAINLALFSGKRRHDICSIKFSDINEDAKGVPVTIRVLDRKKSRLVGKSVFTFVPIIEQLRETIYDCGYEEYKGTDRYIIADEEKNREDLPEKLSRRFIDFYAKLKTGRAVKFKSLRKTYATYADSFIIMNPKALTHHGDNRTAERHYILAEKRAKTIARSGFRIFDDFDDE